MTRHLLKRLRFRAMIHIQPQARDTWQIFIRLDKMIIPIS